MNMVMQFKDTSWKNERGLLESGTPVPGLIGAGAVPPFPQKKAERMGHGAFVAKSGLVPAL
jgi:hypothetical protein